MLKTELVTIDGKQFVRTYSDQEGFGVMRDDVIYEEAYDPFEYSMSRKYTEVEMPEEEV